jgi:endonuclease/exonuclease/phosphatase family metal-dependent hydrolase
MAVRAGRRITFLAVLALFHGCAVARNYPAPLGPRFAGQYAGEPSAAVIRVVTFNLKYGRDVAGALSILQEHPRLRGADILALQEMDEAGVDCLARALSLNYVYYPAAVHPADDRNFGNAILSPWPIEDALKLVLPHPGRFRRMQRIAVVATVKVRGDLPVRVFSVHLETQASLGPGSRRDQARAVVESALSHPRVVVAGDFNGRGVASDVFVPAGFDWLTRNVGHTISRFSWDHVLVRGLVPRACVSAGTARSATKASDHLPVWAELTVPDRADPLQ